MKNKEIENVEQETIEQEKKEKPWYIFSIISAILYSVFIFIGFDYGLSKTFAIVIICFEVVYVAALVMLIFMTKDKSRLGSRIKNYKIAVKLLKSVVSIVCLVVSIGVIINSASAFDFSNFFDICYKIFMIAFSVVSICISIATIIFRKKINETKQLLKEKLKENFIDVKIKR